MTTIKIGTRGSPLALAQAHMVARALSDNNAVETEIVVIKVTGDQVLDRPLAEVGGKGLFTKEIERALIDGAVDCAVHSAKDLETVLPAALTLGAFLAREDVRDAFIGRGGQRLSDLPAGATVGTASLRRQALVRRARPDLRVAVLRGNVQTRLTKLEAGECDATLLALAGLKRLGMEEVATEILPPETFIPACSQGAIAVEIRRDDDAMIACCAAINHADTERTVSAERGFLAALDGSCHTPIAGHAVPDGARLTLNGLVADLAGAEMETISDTAEAATAEAAGAFGFRVGTALRETVGPAFWAPA